MTASRSRRSRGWVPPARRGGQGGGVRARLPQRVRPADGTTAAARSADPRGCCPRERRARRPGRNGSYLVLRTLRQDVDAFHAFTDTATRDAAGRPDPAQARCSPQRSSAAGPAGHRLSLAPGQDDPSLADSNDFGYHAFDARGPGLPARVARPADEPARLARAQPGDRGVDGHQPPAPAAAPRPWLRLADIGQECGVHFICLNANLARQYEFVQHTWVNNPVFNGLEDETDPLVGRRSSKRSYFTTPARPVRRRYTELPQFVHVRGGAYFFLPGIRALRFLAATSSQRHHLTRGRPVSNNRPTGDPGGTTTRRSGGPSTRSPGASTAASGGTGCPSRSASPCSSGCATRCGGSTSRHRPGPAANLPSLAPADGRETDRADAGRHATTTSTSHGWAWRAPGSAATSRWTRSSRTRPRTSCRPNPREVSRAPDDPRVRHRGDRRSTCWPRPGCSS